MTRHACHARGCWVTVPPKMFMCRKHWFMLPQEMRDEIWAAYRPGQEVTKDPSDAYLHAANRAVILLADIEDR